MIWDGMRLRSGMEGEMYISRSTSMYEYIYMIVNSEIYASLLLEGSGIKGT